MANYTLEEKDSFIVLGIGTGLIFVINRNEEGNK